MQHKYVLSLDGGGSHLLIQLSVLACLEEDSSSSTYNLFDMVAGSSSGGLIACLILGRTLTAKEIIHTVLQEKMLEKMMAEHRMSRLLNLLQIRPKYKGTPKSLVLKKALGNLRLSSLNKRILIPSFNLNRDQLEIFTNESQPDFLLSEVADACTAAPAYYPPVQMEDGSWRIDGGIGMNNPGLSVYLHAKRFWKEYDIKVLSIGSGWRSFAINGIKACGYGGVQWSAKGVASLILREKMIANVKITEEILGDRVLYINHYLKNYDMPGNMDSANNPVFQQKALEIGRMWYAQHREQIQQWLQI
ncbi:MULTISPECIES: patatin-like phospholipase family protein [Nitrosomonas]|uniref:Patatin n=1 Tax=Nitrosomonas communis TaxID=44574 RepID=A0A0F7KJC3_9PROT|nr:MULTISPECIES: patatin-like phospholipase family protein [Nitrosomonas]AKH38862.1 patatin [Nitrosomonas communis]TYP88254.1 patatin-like phospholipase/acyl hydrolase [Nitrosomonas communis]UVS60986.1 patatin-like phospholipase family protein [Nitrosomonas sp. PLL12]